MTMAERRAAATAQIVARTGIDDAMIERLVRAFYGKVRDDALLGPIFDERIADWEPHLRRMCSFWSSVALLSGIYHGRPMEKHLPLGSDLVHWEVMSEAVIRRSFNCIRYIGCLSPLRAKEFMLAAIKRKDIEMVRFLVPVMEAEEAA